MEAYKKAATDTVAIPARRKPCTHCLYGNQALGVRQTQLYMKARVADKADRIFFCHEHSKFTACAGFRARYPERMSSMVLVEGDGDLKEAYSNAARKELDQCTIV